MTALAHDAFLYSDDDEFVASMAPFLRDGLGRGEDVVAVTAPSNLTLLRDELGDDATRVRWVDARTWYARPMPTVAAYAQVFRDALRRGAPGVRAIGEVQFGPMPELHDEWICYESILNRAFAAMPAWVVCPYDTRRLPSRVVDSAAATHPFVLDRSGRVASARYDAPEHFVGDARPFATPSLERLQARAPDVDLPLDAGVAHIRRELIDAGRARTGDARLVDQFVLAVNEITTNAILHGGGRGSVRMWADAAGLACVVSDAGSGLDDVLAGVDPPGSEHVGGRGLWIARQLCDSLRLGRSAAGGLSVELRTATR